MAGYCIASVNDLRARDVDSLFAAAGRALHGLVLHLSTYYEDDHKVMRLLLKVRPTGPSSARQDVRGLWADNE